MSGDRAKPTEPTERTEPNGPAEPAEPVDARSGREASAGSARLAGRVAVVTGGASGIGAAVVERITAEGGRVAIGDLPGEALDAVVARYGPNVVGVGCDVTSDDGPPALISAALEWFGRLDIAVTSAGGATPATLLDQEAGEWRRIVDLNLTGTFLTFQAAAGAMSGGGSIVAIASLNAVQPAKRMGAYCAAKAGVLGLVGVAALELGELGVRVNAVAPGLVRTPATDALWSRAGVVAAYEDNTALGRHAEPADIAAAVAFLASDDAAFVTGTTMLVDGGAQHLACPDLGRLAPYPS